MSTPSRPAGSASGVAVSPSPASPEHDVTVSSPVSSPATSADGGAAARRTRLTHQNSSMSTPTKARLEPRRLSSEGSVRRRRASGCRRMSSFDFAHTNALPFASDVKRLESIDLTQVPWWTSQRFRLSILCFFGFVVLYAQRVNLSIAIVSMVDHDNVHHHLDTNASHSYNATNATGGGGNVSVAGHGARETPGDEELCPELEKGAGTKGEFHWDKKLQGLILGAFFWGYMLLQVVGGTVSERFGAKRVIAIGMFPVAVLNILTPLAARADPHLFLVLRVFVGLGEGVMYPAAQALWSQWAPPNERSRLIGFSYAGGQFGNAIAFPIGGYLSAYGFDGGWPSVFYVIGAAGFIWCVFWVIFAFDTPEQSPYISDIEKKYIQAAVGLPKKTKDGKRRGTPWRAILTSRGMWAIIVAHACGNYGAYMLLTQIPTYMKEVLKFDIKSNGLFSMLPYLTFWFFITVSGMLADFLISREILSIAWTRKLMASIGTIGPGCFLIGTGYMDCTQQMEAVAMLVFAVGLCGFHFSGYFINHGDIAPAYAGTMFGISNTAATVPGILAPFVVSALTPDGSREQWQVAFFVAACVYFLGAGFYLLMAQGEVQPWAQGADEAGDVTGGDEEADVQFQLREIAEAAQEEGEGEAEAEEDKAAERLLRGVSSNGASTGQKGRGGGEGGH